LRLVLALVPGLALALACGSGGPAPAPAPAPAEPTPAAAAAPPADAPPPSQPVPAAAAEPPERRLTQENLCADSGLLLTQHKYEDLQAGGYCKLCAQYDEYACELDWPSSDVPACETFDLYRNTIMAWHGHVFQNPDYKAWFEGMSWYKADPNFKGEGLSEIEKANIALLKRKAEKKEGCQPYPTLLKEMLETL
jgi:hypothetical protein